MRGSFILFIGTLLALTCAWAEAPFANLDVYKSSLGFSRFYSQQNPGRVLKVAILDSDFTGYEVELGKTLPASTRYVDGPQQPPRPTPQLITGAAHGLQIAQLFVAMMTDNMRATQWMPELTLYKISSYAHFKFAINDLIAQRVDLVLDAEVWKSGGNFDGTGFINNDVNQATQRGVIWVNAAGDFAKTTFNAGVHTFADNWVQLPDQNGALMIRCENNRSGTCPVEIALSWNDFKIDPLLGTNKDLDLVLTDDLLNILKTSTLKQSADPNESRPGYTKLAYESISTELSSGVYFLRVKNRSQNFSGRDQLRLIVEGSHITMPSHTEGETLLSPADNNTVIAVGASDNMQSSSSISLGKPDLFAPSSITMHSGAKMTGSSPAAAIVAAGLGILKSQEPAMTREDLIDAVTSSSGNWDQRGLSLQLLGFGPTGPGCFWDVMINPLPGYLQEVVSKGGVLVDTTAAVRVMVPFDPLMVAPHLRRYAINDMIVALPHGGYAVYPRYAPIPNGAAEIFQRPLEAGLCRPRPGGTGKNFHL